MALNFPSNPSLNDSYSFNGKTWVFNGSAWIQTRTENQDITTTGNVTANAFIGDGSQLTGINVSGGSVTTSNAAPSFPNDGDVWFDTESGKQFTYINDGDSSQWVETQAHTSLSLGGGDVDLSAVDQNIVPSANITYDLGSETNRWRDIYLANSTIYLGEANISAQGGALTLPSTVSIGNSVLDASSGNLTLPSTVSIGNVTIDASSGNLSLPEGSSIGGATVATPRIASIDYGDDDTAANIAGGQTIGIVGSGFSSGAQVLLDGSSVGVVTVVNSNRIEITAPAKTTGSYSLYVINSDGATGIYIPGIQYSGVPAWSSPSAGSLGSVYETGNISQTFSANSDSNVSYSLYSGNLPTGTTLDANTGVLSGTANLIVGSSVTYNFTIRATDEENQDTDRAFSLTVDADSVTWSSPTDGDTLSLTANTSSSTTLVASSAAGDTIDYTANTLPNGLSLSGNIISGTPTSIANTSVALTATANTTTRSSTITVTFVVALPLGDEYFNQTSLLLNADDNTFITDASDNAFTITPVADTRPSAFSPYNTNWSNYFDGTGDNLITGASNFSTSNFTLEFWLYPTSFASTTYPVYSTLNGAKADQLAFELITNGTLLVYISGTSVWNIVSGGNMGTITLNSWNHVALVREGNAFKSYINGTQGPLNTSSSLSIGTLNGFSVGSYVSAGFYTGYISNLRQVIGTAVYTENFTPPTSPLTAISGTQLLTCQSNRLIDNSTNNFTVTRNGDVKVTSFGPFTETDTSTGSGYFDGTGDYLTVNNFNGSLGAGDYTIEFWFNTNDTNNFEFFAPTASLAGPAIIGASTTTLAVQYRYGDATGFSWTTGNVFDNNWHHLALVRNGTTVTLYVDGISRASGTNSPATDYSGVTTNWTLGFGNQGAGRIYLGYMSNFRVVAGTAVYTGNFTPPSEPLTAIAGTQLLTLQHRVSYNNSQPIDESGIRNIITRNGNASIGAYSPHVPTGWSAYFDGTGDYVAVDQGETGLENWYSEDYSIEMWVNPSVHAQSGTNATGLYVVHGVYNTSTAFWSLGTTSTGLLRWLYYNGAVVSLTATENALPLSVWSHVALVYTHSTGAIKGYVNGVEVFSGTKVGTPQSTSTNDINIGVSQGTYYTGHISNLRIVKGTAVYTSAFTPPIAPLEPIAGISLLTMRGSGFTDDGPNRFAITRNGDTKITPFSPFAPHTITPDSHSVYFDGTGDGIYHLDSTGTDFGTGDFTMECWFYPMSSGATAGLLMDTSKTSVYSNTIGISYKGSTNQIILFHNGSGSYRTATTTLDLNQWHHVALIRASSSLRIFLNGIESTWTAGATTLTVDFNQNNIFIGRWGGNASYPFLGYISNVRVVKGTAVYTSDFTPPSSPLTAVSGTSVLTCQSSTIVDNSTNNLSLTIEGNSQPTQFNPFGETVTEGVEYSPASHGGSVYFDGTGDYLNGISNSELAFGTGDFTVECWVRPEGSTTFSGEKGFLQISPTAGGFSATYANGIALAFNSSGMYFVVDGALNTGSVTLTLNQWYHVALTRESGELRGFVNGQLVHESTNNGDLSGSNLVIGGYSSTTYVLQGYISNLRIVKGTAVYTAAFTPPTEPLTAISGTTLLVNGTNAAIQDKTGRNVLETVGDARVVNGVRKYGSGAMYFDGTGDYIRAAPSDLFNVLGTEFTLEAWIYATDLASAGPFSILGKYGNWYWIVYGSTNAGLFRMIGSGGAVVVSATGANSGIQQDTWHHVAFTRDSSNIPRLFVDGNLVATGAAYTASFDNTMQLAIGSYQGSSAGYTWKGYIDDLRITRGVARYTTSFTPPTGTYTLK